MTTFIGSRSFLPSGLGTRKSALSSSHLLRLGDVLRSPTDHVLLFEVKAISGRQKGAREKVERGLLTVQPMRQSHEAPIQQADESFPVFLV